MALQEELAQVAEEAINEEFSINVEQIVQMFSRENHKALSDKIGPKIDLIMAVFKSLKDALERNERLEKVRNNLLSRFNEQIEFLPNQIVDEKAIADTIEAKSVQLYMLIINLYQDVGLFDPHAKIVIYTKAGYRQEIPFDYRLFNVHWRKDVEGRIGIALKSSKDLEGDLKRTAQEIRQKAKENVGIKNEMAIFSDIIYQTYRGRGGPHDKWNTYLKMYIPEAYETHYLRTHKQGKDSTYLTSSTDAAAHFGGITNAWNLIKGAMGGKAGYLSPDTGSSQVKRGGSSTFMSISNLANMMTYVMSIKKLLESEEGSDSIDGKVDAVNLINIFNAADKTKFTMKLIDFKAVEELYNVSAKTIVNNITP